MQWKTDWGLRLRMGITMFLLFALYLVFAGFIVAYLGGGAAMFLLLMGSFSLGQWYFSDKLTLWSMGAKEVSEAEHPELHRSIRRLSQQADLPMPKVAVVDSEMPNAFATGRSKNHAAVAVTTGILQTLDRDELEGVLAHELSHIKNRDMTVMTVASFLSTVAFLVVRWGWLFAGGRNRQQGGASVIVAILASLVVWIISYLLIRALSRYREFAADRGAAMITGKPSAMASALMKIDNRMDRVPERDLREQSEMNAFFIVPIDKGMIAKLFSTQEPTEKRVERLRELEREVETV
ncbi:zinc metalloprotease HtpX [Halanaeroarchaeum sulfurireducens]|uniref:Protease HtpX homolog n=1 Tax=Halanaeroarchaeum sulfurireducens TaxID=1604004 RepID=A0A0N9MLW1_9EURY|nr:zinc metalloprotease HtpX [Halanaeroarchaeum sulfurireducens]ALG83002.1 heat shock protein HtpX [Halanaeroarchaeum sulfurireducens]